MQKACGYNVLKCRMGIKTLGRPYVNAGKFFSEDHNLLSECHCYTIHSKVFTQTSFKTKLPHQSVSPTEPAPLLQTAENSKCSPHPASTWFILAVLHDLC